MTIDNLYEEHDGQRLIVNQGALLGYLIHARTALKTDRPEEALKTVRALITAIDPDRSREMAMREGAPRRTSHNRR